MNKENINNNEFDRCKVLYENLFKAITNASKRIAALKKIEEGNNIELAEIIKESIIQTHEIATELAWKTAKCYALKIEPSGKVSGSTTAIKLALSTGVIKSEELSRKLIEAVQHRNMYSHEYLLMDGLDEYVDTIRNVFNPALQEFISNLEEL